MHPLGARSAAKSRSFRIWILALAACLAILAGLFTILSPLEDVMKIARNRLLQHPASGQIVLVAVDDRSLAQLGLQTWPRSYSAQLIAKLRRAGARRVILDADTSRPESAVGDRALQAELIAARPRVWLTARSFFDEISSSRFDRLPMPRFAAHANIANDNTVVERNTVWEQFYAFRLGGRIVPSVASILGDRTGRAGSTFDVNYAVDPRSVLVISAADIIQGGWRGADVRHRDVVIGDTSSGARRFTAPGYGFLPAIMFQILGAETLKQRLPADIGWLLPLCATLAAAAGFLFISRRFVARATLSAALLALVCGPLVLEWARISGDYMPSFLALFVVIAAHAIDKTKTALRTRGTVNVISGMKNFNALRQDVSPKSKSVLAARILNYPEISSALPAPAQRELVEQIERRLLFAAARSEVFQGDEGIFAWVSDCNGQDALSEQIEALHALFRSPVVVAGRLIDLAVSFGVDVDATRPILQRASSALVAADEAARQGRRWLTYDPSVLEDADWRMSVLARLDQAIDAGEIWVAYQPKLDLSEDRIVGAEALARWTHPERGEISPAQFIPAAEKGDRIEKLTAFVLEDAIRAAAAINRDWVFFEIAVNISARLLTDHTIVELVARLLEQYRLPPQCLILEVTETAAIDDQDKSLETLHRLFELGVSLSIDDYGTGFSTLEYLRKIPAKEIKIDRSFVSLLDKSLSDRIMVNSTVQLAHSLGRKVVAEGVETAEVLQELSRMGCDLAQGYHIGRPVPLDTLLSLSTFQKASRAA